MADNAEELRRRGELLWASGERPTRGPKRALSAEDVVQAAIGIADRQGLASVTMQAVAAELGFTTMALYRYFPSKDALVDAIVDAAMGTPPARTGPRGPWREEVERWAWAKRAMLMSHPWLGELPFMPAPHGPNWLSWLEGAVDSLSGTGLGAVDVIDMLNVLDGYVRGGSETAISLAKSRAQGIPDAEWGAAISQDLMRAVGDPRFPVLSALFTSEGRTRAAALTERTGDTMLDGLNAGFDFGLQRVLDGIATYVDATRSTARAPSRSAPRRRQR